MSFKKQSRNNSPYECRCKLSGHVFKTHSQFDQHCKSNTHQNFLRNYEKYYKDSDNAKREIRDLQISLGKSDKHNRELQNKLSKAHHYITELQQHNDQLLKDNHLLQISDIDRNDTSDEEDMFSDCQ